jgi:shikimate dehydrogenase
VDCQDREVGRHGIALAELSSMHPYRVHLFGFPLGHTVSPAMHHAAASELGFRLEYTAVQVMSEGLATEVERLRDDAFLGANVTLPHKPAMLTLVDSITTSAQRIRAINTVYKRDNALIGENTDAPAMMRCLREMLAYQPHEESVVLLGAGGAARAAAVALLDAGTRQLRIWNRTRDRSAELVAGLHQLKADNEATVQLVGEGELDTVLNNSTMVINATSVGLDRTTVPFDVSQLASGARVFDMVYGPEATPLVREARIAGIQALDGLWMLVYQAAAAFTLWTGLEPPEHVMHEAALAALHARNTAQQDVPHAPASEARP